MSTIPRASNAYAYPLLIRQLLHPPMAHARHQEIVYRDQRRHTYAEFEARIARLANALAELGVGLGAKVLPVNGEFAPDLDAMHPPARGRADTGAAERRFRRVDGRLRRRIRGAADSCRRVARVRGLRREHARDRPLHLRHDRLAEGRVERAAACAGGHARRRGRHPLQEQPCRTRGAIPKFAVPQPIHRVEAIPKTSVGKVDKKLLRQRYPG